MQRSHAPRSSRARPKGGRLARVSLLLLRAVLLCLVVQMSGVVHFAIDLLLQGEAAAEHFSEQGDEDDGDCPPGCPSCHCVHAATALPVPSETFAEFKLLPAFEMVWAPYEAGVPPALAPPTVYRPPRV